jgi:DNA-binding Lrp family transcriptional regulator
MTDKKQPSQRKHGQRFTASDHASIIKMLMVGNVTMKDIAQEINASEASTRKIVAVLEKYGFAKKTGVRPLPPFSQAAEFSIGDGVPLVKSAPIKKIRVTAVGYCILLSEMLEGATLREIEEQTGMSRSSIEVFISAAHKAKIIHICGYAIATSGPYSRIFKFGSRRDASKPKLVSKTLINQRFRAKQKECEQAKNLYRAFGAGSFVLEAA